MQSFKARTREPQGHARPEAAQITFSGESRPPAAATLAASIAVTAPAANAMVSASSCHSSHTESTWRHYAAPPDRMPKE